MNATFGEVLYFRRGRYFRNTDHGNLPVQYYNYTYLRVDSSEFQALGMPEFFSDFLFAYITAMIIHLFILSSAVQMYEFSYIHFHLISSMGISVIRILHNDQLPVRSIVQLVEHYTGIAEVMGSNPIQA